MRTLKTTFRKIWSAIEQIPAIRPSPRQLHRRNADMRRISAEEQMLLIH